MSCARPPVRDARRVVVKVGTRVLTGPAGKIALSRLFDVVEALAEARAAGREVLLVTSGAVGLGREALGLAEAPSELSDRQACAAIGQSRLMGLYQEGFARLGLLCAQVLLSDDDFAARERYLNLRGALTNLLERGVVPVINENDVIATAELALDPDRRVFGDNDGLSAQVAVKLGAELLVLLTDVPGVFARDPRMDPDAPLVARIDDPERLDVETGKTTGTGRGGMRSKVRAAAMAARSGCHAVIGTGLVHGNLGRILAGEEIGTWFPMTGTLPARARWIAFATKPAGRLHLDAGAERAVRERGASLLASGVTEVEGEFDRGDVVELVGPAGQVLGRGIVQVDAAAARAWREGHAPEATKNRDALVHRDDLVLEAHA